MNQNTRIIDITVGELQSIIDDAVQASREAIERMVQDYKARGDTISYTGIRGMAAALRCSTSKVLRLKREGLLEGGYEQIGKLIYVNSASELIEAIKRNTEAKKMANPYYRKHINNLYKI